MGELSIWGAILGSECTAHGENGWGWIMYPALMLYMFYLLAQICDGHLTLALEFIVEKFKMTEDVAGATFLAMASSAPELFCSIVSTFVLVSASGVGNIVGSAVFNLLVIIGVTPIFAGGSLRIWWYPTVRDACFYTLAIIEIFVFMADGKVYWYEALVMVLSYCCYVFYFTQNQRIIKYLGLRVPGSDENDDQTVEDTAGDKKSPDVPEEEKAKKVQAGTGETEEYNDGETGEIAQLSTSEKQAEERTKGRKPSFGANDFSLKGKRSASKDMTNANLCKIFPEPTEGDPEIPSAGSENDFSSKGKHGAGKADPSSSSSQSEASGEGRTRSKEGANAGECEKGQEQKADNAECATSDEERKSAGEAQDEESEERVWCKWEPLMIIVDFTMPRRPEMVYPLFILCCLWIGLFTYMAVDAADRLGCLMGMPDVVMGLVVLAAGTSVPDAMGSIAVAKEGMGDMAVANAVGSNTFDILLGLGLPWFLKGVITGEPIDVPTESLQEAIIILACCLFLYIVLMVVNKWILSKRMGFCLLALYVFAITWFLVRYFVK